MNDWQRKSPLDWQTYVNKLVKVVAVEKHEYEGWVLTVDPVSATLMLMSSYLQNLGGCFSVVAQEQELMQSSFLDSIVLATFPENEKGSISFIMGHAVQEVEILQEGDSDMEQRLARILAPEESQAYSAEELERRKNALKTWLESNHIPVGEQGELGRTLCVAGVLSIEPPYGPEQCSSTNEIILARVQGLLQGFLQQQR
ncbi:hypothetical protein EK904_006911 [Melospiza melodia maxima]|nr:hypothetical protein EK904_006911 [Melospiza melodia maxima]